MIMRIVLVVTTYNRGWNGIVYFNKDEENSGTNLYDPKVLQEEEWQISLSDQNITLLETKRKIFYFKNL